MPSLRSRAKRRLASHSLLGAGVALVLVLWVIVNYFGWKYYARFDWTGTKLYSISEKTTGILGQLDRDIEVLVFLSPGEQLFAPIMELLASYEEASDQISVRTVDPERDLLQAQEIVDRYQITQLNVLIFDAGDDRRVVDTADLADYDYSGMQYGEGATMVGFKGEQVFSSTLLELMESRKPSILFTNGHGEMSLDDMSERGLAVVRDLLGQDNFQMEERMTLGADGIPDGTDLVIIAGPTSNFIEPEIEILRRYLDRGGRLFLLLDPSLAPAGGLVETGLEALVAEFGIEVGADIVVDPANPLPFFGPETIFVNIYGNHPITRALDQAQLPVVVPLGRSVRAAAAAPEGLTVTELILTSVDGWGETDLDRLDQVDRQDADVPGPVALAVAVEVEEERAADGLGGAPPPDSVSPEDVGRELRIVVVGDADFASNSQMQNIPNATFLANAVNWLVDRETLVGIPAKAPEQVRLSLTRGELARISWLVLAVLPGLALAAGLIVYLKRRR
jgi:ABC-type uncharacterized transport system involved in gliding motility auxiliary subunit